MDNISQNEKLSTIVKALDSKRAEDIRVIANCTSSTHTNALAE